MAVVAAAAAAAGARVAAPETAVAAASALANSEIRSLPFDLDPFGPRQLRADQRADQTRADERRMQDKSVDPFRRPFICLGAG